MQGKNRQILSYLSLHCQQPLILLNFFFCKYLLVPITTYQDYNTDISQRNKIQDNTNLTKTLSTLHYI